MGGGDSEEEGDGDGEAPHGETKLREPWWGVWSDSSDQPDLSLLLLPCQPFHGDVKTPGYFLEAGLPSLLCWENVTLLSQITKQISKMFRKGKMRILKTSQLELFSAFHTRAEVLIS